MRWVSRENQGREGRLERDGNIRYSPIFRSLQRLTVLEITLWDQAAKYMLPTGRPGIMIPPSILDRLFVAIPLP